MKGGPVRQPEEGPPSAVEEAETAAFSAEGAALPPDADLERCVFHHLAQALREVVPEL